MTINIKGPELRELKPRIFEKFKIQARKKANLNRASLKWEAQFKKEGK